MARRRRSVEVFSLSFLDCICCGFGAIILLLVLTQYGDPIQLEERTRMLKGQVAQLEDQLHEIRGETDSTTPAIRRTRTFGWRR
jgi:hypothetical protein